MPRRASVQPKSQTRILTRPRLRKALQILLYSHRPPSWTSLDECAVKKSKPFIRFPLVGQEALISSNRFKNKTRLNWTLLIHWPSHLGREALFKFSENDFDLIFLFDCFLMVTGLESAKRTTSRVSTIQRNCPSKPNELKSRPLFMQINLRDLLVWRLALLRKHYQTQNFIPPYPKAFIIWLWFLSFFFIRWFESFKLAYCDLNQNSMSSWDLCSSDCSSWHFGDSCLTPLLLSLSIVLWHFSPFLEILFF